MAIVPCTYCESSRMWMIDYTQLGPENPLGSDSLNGVIKCDRCGKRTAFTMESGMLTGLPEKVFEQRINKSLVSQAAQDTFAEAESSFLGHAYRATVEMCRSCVEEELSAKNIKAEKLEEAIEDAKQHDMLNTEQEDAANSASLIRVDARDRRRRVTQREAMTALATTVALVNHIGSQSPVPVKPSGMSSNDP